MENLNFNKEFYFVYSPSKGLYPDFSPRFLVSVNTLKKYIGENNANKVILKASCLIHDKCTLRFRKYGKIDIYLK